jgi:hypothetical protein
MEEPDLSLLEPRRFGLVPTLLILVLVLGSLWLLFLPGKHQRKPAPPAPAPQAPARPAALLVTLIPAAAQGWCCAGGRLSTLSRTECDAAKGVFFARQAEASAACPPGAAPAPAEGQRPTATSGSPRGPGTGT